MLALSKVLLGGRLGRRGLGGAAARQVSCSVQLLAFGGKNRQPAESGNILAFKQIRSDLYDEFRNVSTVVGVRWKRFPRLTALLKGHRHGELSLLTGGTGSGKTTLMAELSLDLAVQGVPTLWGSFEIRNVRLAKTMMKQFSGLNLEHHLSEYDYWADQFDQLPLYFMAFHGQADISTVIKTMSEAVESRGIKHVVVDNLQFMLGSGTSHITDCYTAQNQAISQFRTFASQKNVHVSLVVHPRKEAENTILSNSSIFGTAKASQEADNIFILQSLVGKPKTLQVTKNRYDGELGHFPLSWHKDTCTLSGYFSHTHQPRPLTDVLPTPSIRVVPASIAMKSNQSNPRTVLKATSLSDKQTFMS